MNLMGTHIHKHAGFQTHNHQQTNMKRATQLILTIILLAFCAAPIFSQSKYDAAVVYAIRNARIVTVTGATIEKGTVLIRDGKIAAVGEQVSIPGNAKVIDGTGLSVYPGMIDSGTILGLSEVGAVNATVDTTELGDF